MFIEVFFSLLNSEEREPSGSLGCLGSLIVFLLLVFMLWAVFIWGSADKGKSIIEFYFGAD
jgi:uncharacterized BrkB/YihY/UPF0761 family membrane protein